jgi:two-component system, OmpR family, phosphate regulon sensor histidine kinase PhoR
VLTADRRLSARLYTARADELAREASFVAAQWTARTDPAALAATAGRALEHRVTLIDATGRVVGDARFAGAALARLENHAARPEVVQARARGQGVARRLSASAGDEELYVAVRAPLGVARVSTSTSSLEQIIGEAQRDVLAAGLVALLVAAVLTYAFSHSVSRPIVALRDAAREIAASEHAPPPAIRPAIDASGEVGDLAGAVFRMADQLTSRLALVQEDEALLAALVESLAEGIVAADVHGQVVRINASARRMLGIDDPVPVPLARIDDPVVRDALRGALAGTVITQQEMRSGDRVLTLTATPLASAGGAVLTLMDLTQVRRLEAVRRDFVANVSHELKTPLTVVGGFAETLTDDELPAAQRRQFAVAIQANARRMQRIVDDLLDLSRIESGGWVPEPASVELRAAAAEALAAAAATAAAKGIALEVSPGPGAAAVHADPTALRQVLSNLVENAVRHTSAGGVVVATRRNAGYPAGVWLEVRDTGSGIGQKHLPRIFQRFYRPDPGRSRAEGGTGLGLAIVKHLVEAHGGVVRAASAVGQGTTMSAFFPDAGRVPNGAAADG